MNVKILKNITETNVLFSTPIGNGIAACGNKKLREGMACDVEFDIHPGLKYDINAQKGESGHYYLRNDGDFNFLQFPKTI